MMIRSLLDNGERKHAAVDTLNGTRTYRELADQVDELAKYLMEIGLGKGDRIAMALPNGLEVITSFLAASTVGTAAPLNPSYTRDEFKFYLEDTAARALILPKDNSDDARAAATGGKILIIDASIDGDGRVRFSADGKLKVAAAVTTTDDDIALIPHTSR